MFSGTVSPTASALVPAHTLFLLKLAAVSVAALWSLFFRLVFSAGRCCRLPETSLAADGRCVISLPFGRSAGTAISAAGAGAAARAAPSNRVRINVSNLIYPALFSGNWQTCARASPLQSHLRVRPFRPGVQLIQGIQVSLGRSHHYIGIRAQPVDHAAALGQAHRHFALSIGAAGD